MQYLLFFLVGPITDGITLLIETSQNVIVKWIVSVNIIVSTFENVMLFPGLVCTMLLLIFYKQFGNIHTVLALVLGMECASTCIMYVLCCIFAQMALFNSQYLITAEYVFMVQQWTNMLFVGFNFGLYIIAFRGKSKRKPGFATLSLVFAVTSGYTIIANAFEFAGTLLYSKVFIEKLDWGFVMATSVARLLMYGGFVVIVTQWKCGNKQQLQSIDDDDDEHEKLPILQ